MWRNKFSGFLAGLCLVGMVSCQEEFTPKPKGYNRIDLPAPKYQVLQENHPYAFEYSIYSKVLRDSSRVALPHWINVYYPRYQANIQLTYRPLNNNPKTLNALLEDARTLTIKHQVKAEAIEGGIIKTPNGLRVSVAELSGEVPSQFQFYVTDSTQHFFRGALYFRTATANDSLAPVIDYIKKDITHILNTLEFKK
jgi:gliding motility-associated lipoprotein GldD